VIGFGRIDDKQSLNTCYIYYLFIVYKIIHEIDLETIAAHDYKQWIKNVSSDDYLAINRKIYICVYLIITCIYEV
jgi:hypothetical protein